MQAVDTRIYAEQIRLIYHQGPVLVFGSTLCAYVITAFLWRSLPQSALLFWLGALTMTTVLRYLIIRAYRRADDASRRDGHWGPFFWLGTLSAGVIWGAWPIMFYGIYDTEFLLLISTIFAGMVAVSAASGGIYPPSFLSFSMPLVIPLSLAHLASDSDSLRLTGGLLLMFLSINYFLAERGNRHFRALISAQFRNDDLMARLAEEKGIAERAVIAKSRFLAAASHDLRQPLHALGLFIGALRNRERDPKQLAVIDDMSQSADALNGLFNSLLDVSRLDAEIIEFLPRHLAVQNVFERLRITFGQQARAKGLTLDIEEPDCVVYTDEILFERVLRNLVSNAIQYTESGSVRLSCRPRTDGARAITLEDTGIGIPPGEREDVFSEYYQLNNPERDRSKGLGLGLAIVRRLSELMDMPLEMDSEPGVGTRFTLVVPSGDPLQIDAGDTADADRPMSAPGRTILLIDDERQVLQSMRHVLESAGCETLCAESARDALRLLALSDLEPELVLSDYRLREGETGIDAVAAVREALERDLPAAIITGDTSPERLREITASGLEVLHKPVSASDLDALVARLSPRGDDAMPATPVASPPHAAASPGVEVARTSLPTVSP